MRLANIEGITPKDRIDPNERTPGKDQAAEWIQEHVVDPDKWDDYTISQMADESGWSRQHLRNTVQDYFDHIEATENDTSETTVEHNGTDLTITVPNDVDKESYLRGWLAAYVGSS